MKKYDVVIIGCGASGAMCALTTKNKNVAIIDANTVALKKILATGNGRCNLTNMSPSHKAYNQNIDKYLNKFGIQDTLVFFEQLGLEYYSDDEGRVYPLSNTAKSVQDVMSNALDGKVDLYMQQTVKDVDYINNKFVVTTDNDKFECNKLVVSSGGNTFANCLTKLGVKFKPFTPSLVGLKCDNIKDLNGVRVPYVKVTATTLDGDSQVYYGEILFRDNGLSGIVIFNISTLFARNSVFSGNITIDLVPNIYKVDLVSKLQNRKKLNCELSKLFVGMFHNAVANEIFKQAKINTNKQSNKLTNNEIDKLAYVIKNLNYKVTGCLDNSQVHSGGVLLTELDDNLMCKTIPNLYFTGEVCDVDGVCGGYNLQWAWTSGHIVGEQLWLKLTK